MKHVTNEWLFPGTTESFPKSCAFAKNKSLKWVSIRACVSGIGLGLYDRNVTDCLREREHRSSNEG